MGFRDLESGDIFVLRWWLDKGPTIRHYLVVNRDARLMQVLRLEADSKNLSTIDYRVFEESMSRHDVALINVIKAI